MALDDDYHDDITCFGIKEKKSSTEDVRTGTVCTTCCTGVTNTTCKILIKGFAKGEELV